MAWRESLSGVVPSSHTCWAWNSERGEGSAGGAGGALGEGLHSSQVEEEKKSVRCWVVEERQLVSCLPQLARCVAWYEAGCTAWWVEAVQCRAAPLIFVFSARNKSQFCRSCDKRNKTF